MNRHMNYFFMHSEICVTNELYKEVKTFLSERYKDAINRQIVGLFKSKITNFKRRFVQIVMGCDSLSDELKKDLCIVNKYGIYFKNEDTKGKKHIVPSEHIKLAR